jgi:hypothetical protein
LSTQNFEIIQKNYDFSVIKGFQTSHAGLIIIYYLPQKDIEHGSNGLDGSKRIFLMRRTNPFKSVRSVKCSEGASASGVICILLNLRPITKLPQLPNYLFTKPINLNPINLQLLPHHHLIDLIRYWINSWR